MHVRYAFQLAG